MCSLLVRREALLELGGLEAQFRGLYEDQVLYVKAGLQLTAVIDPRPLALYRQHPGSACEVSIAEGAWSREGPSAAATRFFKWMESYVHRETGPGSEESAIVERNLEHYRTYPGPPDGSYASCFAARRRSRCARRGPWFRRRWRSTQQAQPPISVVGEWSAQHLRVITASLSGSVLVSRLRVPRMSHGHRLFPSTGSVLPRTSLCASSRRSIPRRGSITSWCRSM